jgi:hypothetical protein
MTVEKMDKPRLNSEEEGLREMKFSFLIIIAQVTHVRKSFFVKKGSRLIWPKTKLSSCGYNRNSSIFYCTHGHIFAPQEGQAIP